MDTLPTTDPVALLRARDGIYADDLLIAAVAHLDLFTPLPSSPAMSPTWRGSSGSPSGRRTSCPRCSGPWASSSPVPCCVPPPFRRAPGTRCAIRPPPLPGLPRQTTGHACALLEDRPSARATILERPPVDALARRLLAARGWAERSTVVGGDMFVTILEGHDLCLLSHTLHDWGEHDVRRLLERCFDALAPGGWLVDHDAHVNRDKTGRLPVARYSVLLMHTTAGKCWSVAELGAMLEKVGFEVEERPAGPDRRVVVAREPS